MRARIPLVLALLVGVLAGAAGVWALCNQGYCGDEDSATSGNDAPHTAVFGAGSTQVGPNSRSAGSHPAPTSTPKEEPGQPAEDEPGTTAEITGLAIISDSTADEYRADNPRGGDYGATTFNWVELLAGQGRVNVGEWEDARPEPRRGGYAFNWSRSGATSETMIRSGAHTGAAEQIEAGEVSHVIIQIGLNDFYWEGEALAIYTGELSGDDLQLFLDDIVANIELAVQTVKGVGNENIILATTQDYVTPLLVPGLTETFPDLERRQRVIDAFSYVNEGLRQVAEREDVHFFDFNAALFYELDSRYDPADQSFILVGGERIDLTAKSNEPHHGLVDDEYAHPGTALSALFANLYIAEMNDVFGTDITPFSDEEILRIAGMQ